MRCQQNRIELVTRPAYPFQLLVVVIIEASLFVVNGWIGYTVLGVADVGGAMFIHTFGAYFGLACSLMFRGRSSAI